MSWAASAFGQASNATSETLAVLGDWLRSEWVVAVQVGIALVTVVVTGLTWSLYKGKSKFQVTRSDFIKEKRRFLVTCASSQLGKRLVLALLERNHEVVATDKDFRVLKAAAADGLWHDFDVELRPMDPAVEAHWESVKRLLLRKFGGVDVVINLSAAGDGGTPDSPIEAYFNSVVLGVECTKELIQAGGKQPIGCHIINFFPFAARDSDANLEPAVSGSLHGARTFSLSSARKHGNNDGLYITSVLTDIDHAFGRNDLISESVLENLFEGLLVKVLVSRSEEYIASYYYSVWNRMWRSLFSSSPFRQAVQNRMEEQGGMDHT